MAGHLGASSFGVIPLSVGEDAPPLGSFFTLSGGGSGYVRFDDLIITNTDNPTNTDPVLVSTNFLLDGILGFSQILGENAQARVSVSVQYGIGFFPNFLTPNSIGSITRGRSRSSDLTGNTGVFSSAGLGSSTSINQVFETPSVEVAVGVPIPLVLSVGAGVALVSRDGSGVSGFADFLNTLAFPSTGPVFNLPNGYTASSTQAGIMDNKLASATATPVPASWTLIGFCAALLGIIKLRRTHIRLTTA